METGNERREVRGEGASIIDTQNGRHNINGYSKSNKCWEIITGPLAIASRSVFCFEYIISGQYLGALAPCPLSM